MRKILFFLLFIPLFSYGQFESNTQEFEFSGTLFTKSIFRGGIDFDDSKIAAVPLENYTICLIEWHSNDSIPVFVKKITTDKNGKFRTKLSAGHYGFATSEELDSLQAGQWLPQPQEKWSGHNVTSSSWQLSTTGPIDLRSSNVEGLSLIFHQTTFCVDCQ